jgi:hypothetical protein
MTHMTHYDKRFEMLTKLSRADFTPVVEKRPAFIDFARIAARRDTCRAEQGARSLKPKAQPSDTPLFEVMTPERIAWFWANVDRAGGDDACHPWRGRKGCGYGVVRIDDYPSFPAHRVAWALTYNFDPDTFARPVRHACRDYYCCNPRHLVYDAPPSSSLIRKFGIRPRKATASVARPSAGNSTSSASPIVFASMWTAERVAELTRLWNKGVPSPEIGRRMGVTKNMVLGKAFRLRLKARAPARPRLALAG